MATEWTDDEALEALGSEGRLTHVFEVLTDVTMDCSIRLLSAVERSGARLGGLRMASRGSALEHRLELKGIPAGEARRLADHFSSLEGVRFASVEHRVPRVGA